jgi:uncharacterized membrane protein YoaK (UPF0700 family)
VFQHEGPTRSARKNEILAGYLALVAGFVNSGGFILIGSFTSHVTGSIGRSSIDLAQGGGGASAFAVLLIVGFFAGAFVASLIIETSIFRSTARAYAVALLVEGILLASFIFVAGFTGATHARALDAEAAILCLAMGMQNALVTRLSGAVVRTTHLTGVVTDLAIETSRWWRWHRANLLPQLTFDGGRNPPKRPMVPKFVLLATIVGAFAVGSYVGAMTVLRASRWAMALPAALILAASLYAFLDREDH